MCHHPQREKAFAIFHYPCIGRWRFLDLYLAGTPEYPAIVSRLKSGDQALLDVGCCFGHILRQLAFDGVPDTQLAGTDLRPEFVDLGYELFRDKDKFAARFVTGNIFDGASDDGKAFSQALDGKFDIIHAASFFHLFGYDDQLRIGERIVRFLKPGAKDALIVGRQVGTHTPVSVEEANRTNQTRYHHNVESFQKLWDVVGERTGTKWRATGDLQDADMDGVTRTIIRFAVSRVG